VGDFEADREVEFALEAQGLVQVVRVECISGDAEFTDRDAPAVDGHHVVDTEPSALGCLGPEQAADIDRVARPTEFEDDRKHHVRGLLA
jgi:hypothetical protein